MKTNFKKRVLISIGIIAGSLLAASIGLYYLSGDMNANAAKLVSDRASMQAQTAELDKLATLEQDAPIAAKYQTAIDTLIPGQYQLINFGQWLDGMGRVYGVVATFSFQGNPTTPPAGSVGTVPFALDVQGPFAGVVSFLQSLEAKSPGFLLTLGSFDITNDAAGNAHLTAQGSLYFK